MLKSVRGVSAAALLLGLFGCSAIPDQAQMTGVDIVDIIKNVRCELKDALLEYPDNAPINKMIIGYNFEFTAMEENVTAGGATFAIPLAHGTFKIGFDASERGHREDLRTIIVSEAIGNVRKITCGQPLQGDTLHYPVTGKVGIGDVVKRYATLQKQDGLRVGTFTDQLYFWLQYDGSVKPSVSLIPLSKHNIDANMTIGGTRKDAHRVTLTITKPTTDKPLEVHITNLPPQGGAQDKSAESPRGGGASSAGGDPRDKAIRDLQNERSLRINQDILDRLR